MNISKVSYYFREQVKAAAGDRFLLLLISLGLLSAALIMLREINYGVGLMHDSVIYFAAARNLASGNGLVFHTGEPLATWAPLFPTLLAAPERLGWDARPAAGLLNAAATGALVVVVGWWLRRRFGSTPLALWGTLAVLLSIPLTRMGVWAMSEPVFLLLATLALLCAAQFLDGGQRRALVGAAVFTALACLTRYVGITIIFAVAPLLLCRRGPLPARAQNAALYCVIAALPLGAWMVRNYLRTGMPFGPQGVSGTTLSEYLEFILGTIASWVFPVGVGPEGYGLPGALLGLVVLTPLAVAGILAVWQWWQEGRVSGALLLPGVFSLFYIAFLLTISNFRAIEWPKDRLVSPVYVPLVLAVAAIAAYWLRRGWRAAAWRVAPLVGLCLGLAYPLAVNAADIRQNITEGTGTFSTARWANSELVPQLKGQLAGIEYHRLYSNEIPVLYFHVAVPARALNGSRSELRRFYQNQAATDDIYVLWVKDPQHAPWEYDQRDLEQILPNPQTLIEDKDGTLYYASAAGIAESIYAAAQEMGAPAISAVYDVYVGDDRLIYVKEPCAIADTTADFWLHLYPTNRDDLDEWRVEYGFNDLSFEFDRRGRRFGEICVASVPYPGYDLARIRTGQRAAAGVSWAGMAHFQRSDFQQAQLDALAARQPVADDHFAIYRLDDKLAYLKEPCAAGDTAAPFYLHIVPAYRSDLPAAQREYGYDNRDFAFDANGWSFGGQCLATVDLPEYDIVLLRTGQYTAAGRLWESEVSNVGELYAAIRMLDGPAVAAVYDLYIDDGRLIYLKESCAAADTAAAFYLHIVPVDVVDLPAAAQEYGFENRDFIFGNHGWAAAEKCVAVVELPEYDIARIRTGQYTDAGRLWASEFPVGAP